MNDAYQTEMDDLALGLTRPPMFMGVNIRVFFGNLMLCTMICLNAHTWLGVPLFALIHVIAMRLSIKEPDFFNLNVSAFIKIPPMLNRWYWGKLNSYEPW